MIPIFLTWHRLRHELSQHGDQQKSSESLPSADQVNNTVSAPLVLTFNRYFKPVWKPGHLLDNNLKSCVYCLRSTTQILFASKAKESIHE